MTPAPSITPYVLGTTDTEHARLIVQAACFEQFTERLFRDAGIGRGHRVLDIGSGVGDVALLAGRIVGPAGEVVGVDRDAIGLAKARKRAAAAGFDHLRFVESDVSQFVIAEAPFDAAVGRVILQFVPDPVVVLRTLSRLVRPGGVVVFQEPSWAALLAQTAHLPLRSVCVALIVETFRRSQVRTEMGLSLFRDFQKAGLPPPEMRLEIPIGDDPQTRQWLHNLFCTVKPRFEELGIALDALGDADTLAERLERELDATGSYAACLGLVGAWSRKPMP